MPIIALALAALAGPQEAAWPQFRGVHGDGLVAGECPVAWGPETNVAWTRELPGSGWSSPVVVGERIFVTCAVDDAGGRPMDFQSGVTDPATMGQGEAPESDVGFQVHALSLADGATLWERELGVLVPPYGIHPSNTYATETPATDGERLFVTFGALGSVIALDLDGEQLWRTETGVFKTFNSFGWGSSLVCADGLVFLQNDNEEESFLTALSAADGSEVWTAERPKGTAWSTPLLWPAGDAVDLVVCGPQSVTGYAPDTGKVRWSLEGIAGSFSSSPGADAEHLYLGNSGPMARGPLVAIGKGAEGTLAIDAEEPGWLSWVVERAGPGFASPVAAGGLVFVLASNGVLACHDAASGEQLWRERLPDAATIVASPWTDGERVFLLDETGKTFVVRAAREFELLGANELPGLYWATPALAGGSLLLRSSTGLTCVRTPEEE